MNEGIAVQIMWMPPRIVSVTIDAPITGGKYQLYVGLTYTASVIVKSGNISYDLQIESRNLDDSVTLMPSLRSQMIPQFSGDYVFKFNLLPNVMGTFQLAFQLRDKATLNEFDISNEVAFSVLSSAPKITSTTIAAPTFAGRYQLEVGRRYLVKVRVEAGMVPNSFQVEHNENMLPPDWVNLHNRASSLWRLDPGEPSRDFTFTIAPTCPGRAQIAFMLRDSRSRNDGWIFPGTGNAYGHDGGVAIEALAKKSGIYGTVRRLWGLPISGVKVTLFPSDSIQYTGISGSFHFLGVQPGTSYRLRFSKPGYSRTEIVNIKFDGGGFNADAKMEARFSPLTEVGIRYERYIDRSRGYSLLHVLRIPHSSTRIAIRTSTFNKPGDGAPIHFQTAREVATELGARVVINGGFFDAVTGDSIGYYYSKGFHDDSKLFEYKDNVAIPVLGIIGDAVNQDIRIANKHYNFTDPASIDWNTGVKPPIWDDAPRDGISDVDYALQMDVPLNIGNAIPDFTGEYADYWARSAVGLDSSGDLMFVIADGERILGVQGASLTQLGEFFRDELRALISMPLDGGGSSTVVVKSDSGYKNLVQNTPENPRWDNPPQGWGVLNYFVVW